MLRGAHLAGRCQHTQPWPGTSRGLGGSGAEGAEPCPAFCSGLRRRFNTGKSSQASSRG